MKINNHFNFKLEKQTSKNVKAVNEWIVQVLSEWTPDQFLDGRKYYSVLPDLLAAPPHLPAESLHLLQLHDAEKIISPDSLLLFPTALVSDLPLPLNFLQIQCDRLVIHGIAPVVGQLETNTRSFYPPPSSGSGSCNCLFQLFPFCPINPCFIYVQSFASMSMSKSMAFKSLSALRKSQFLFLNTQKKVSAFESWSRLPSCPFPLLFSVTV